MSQPIPPSPDQIRDAIERTSGYGCYARSVLDNDRQTIIAAAKAFAEHMEKQPASLGELDGFGGPRPKVGGVGDVADRLDALERGQRDLRTSTQLAGVNLAGRIAKISEDAALNLGATDTRMDRLSGIIDEQERRLKALTDALHGTDHEGENVKRRLAKLESAPLDVAAINDPGHTSSLPLPSVVAKMPDWYPSHLRGGWYNVWIKAGDRDCLDPQFAGPYQTEISASYHRRNSFVLFYACIYRSSIQRGEGL